MVYILSRRGLHDVAAGTFLMQDHSPLGPEHCVLEPIGPSVSLVDASEEVATEARRSPEDHG